MGNGTQTWECARCGKRCERKAVRGQRPKWCSEECGWKARSTKTGTCAQCGAEYTGAGERFCSVQCSAKSTMKPKPPRLSADRLADAAERRRIEQTSPLRAAYDAGDYAGVVDAIKARATRTVDGCWEWPSVTADGYPVVTLGKQRKKVPVHRLSLEAWMGVALGNQSAHHVCANTRCVNPEHLQPITHRENVAEMLARKAYVARIRELEDALALVAPNHPALSVLPVA